MQTTTTTTTLTTMISAQLVNRTFSFLKRFTCLRKDARFRRFLGSEALEQIRTIQEVRKRQVEELAGMKEIWSQQKQSPSSLSCKLADSQEQLKPRHMRHSYQEAFIPLGSDHRIQEKYLNFHKSVRLGKIMEDLDMFAVCISYQHNRKCKELLPPLVIVTALVDRIDLHEAEIIPAKDIKMSGCVTWTGKTSLEVTMKLHQKQDNVNWKQFLHARFVMVARDPDNKCAAFVHPLEAETAEEEAIMAKGEENKAWRLQRSEQSLMKHSPTAEEREIIHRHFIETLDPTSASFSTRVKPADSVWMEDSKLKNLIICFPEQRNMYNKIFGGFLMRQACELAYATATVYSKRSSFFTSVDSIQFRKPVEIGDLLYLSSQVAYTQGNYMQLRVHADVVDPGTGQRDTTNVFHFTIKSVKPVSTVRPKTYGESMLFLSGRRHFLEFLKKNAVE